MIGNYKPRRVPVPPPNRIETREEFTACQTAFEAAPRGKRQMLWSLACDCGGRGDRLPSLQLRHGLVGLVVPPTRYPSAEDGAPADVRGVVVLAGAPMEDGLVYVCDNCGRGYLFTDRPVGPIAVGNVGCVVSGGGGSDTLLSAKYALSFAVPKTEEDWHLINPTSIYVAALGPGMKVELIKDAPAA